MELLNSICIDFKWEEQNFEQNTGTIVFGYNPDLTKLTFIVTGFNTYFDSKWESNIIFNSVDEVKEHLKFLQQVYEDRADVCSTYAKLLWKIDELCLAIKRNRKMDRGI